MNQLCVGVAARIGGEKPILVGEQHQQVGVDQVGGQRRQVVVIAHANFLGGDGVVFINDRNHVLHQERYQRVARVEIAPPVRKVRFGQQNLGHGQPVQPENLLIERHQARLADGSQHLFGGHVFGQLREVELLAPGGHGTR